MRRITTADFDTTPSLDAIWRAFHRDAPREGEDCAHAFKYPQGTPHGSVYRIEKRGTGSGEGVGASATTTYAYDPFGNRVWQATAGATTTYPNKFYSITNTITGATTTATSTEYLFSGSNLLATIDQELINGTATDTAITRYIHPDNLGSTNVTSDANANLAQWLDYAPYGSVIASQNTGTTTAARQYIGQYYDANSGLNDLQNRYYNSSQGQFLSEDPTFLALGNPALLQSLTQQQQGQLLMDPQQLNAYSYGRDNPITQKDPNGDSTTEFIAKLLYWNSLRETAQSHADYLNDQPGSQQQAEDQSQFEFDVVTTGASTVPTLGLVTAVDPPLGLALDAGTLVLSGTDAYCSSHTCRNFSNSSPNAAEEVIQSVQPNVVLTPNGPEPVAYSNGNGNPATYSYYSNTQTNNSSRASAPSASNGSSGGNLSTLIGLYQSLVLVLTSYVSALTHSGH